MKSVLITSLLVVSSLSAFAQVEVDRQIQMTGGAANDRRITNVSNAADVTPAGTDAVNINTVQRNYVNYSVGTFAGGDYALTLTPAPTAYWAGMRVTFRASAANTGATNLNVNGLGNRALVKPNGGALTAGEISAGQIVEAVFDGANNRFQLVSPQSANAWTTLGNAGTTPANNFLGTTDNQGLVFRTNNTERMRILNTGNVGINNAIPTMMLDAIWNTTTTDNSTIRGLATGNARVYGVYGAVTNSTTAVASGVRGDADAATGFISGVLGVTNSSGGNGVYGFNSSTDATATGVLGRANGAGTGVWGQAFGANGWGTAGIADVNNGRGVYGRADGTNGIGVYGRADGTNGVGVYGRANGTDGTGVYGTTNNATAFGMWGTNTNASGTGIVASGNNVASSYLTNGSGGAFTGSNYGIAAYKSGALADGTGAGYFMARTNTPQMGVAVAYRAGGTNYKIIDLGTFGGNVSTDVWDIDNKTRRIMFAPEAPEIFFQDFGRGQLVNGRAHITLDPIFARNIVVNEQHPLNVFIQLEGDCKGVYVTNKTANGFDVVELNGGTSNVKFSYFVNANRADYVHPRTNELISKHEGVRFPIAPEPLPMGTVKHDEHTIIKNEDITKQKLDRKIAPVEVKKP